MRQIDWVKIKAQEKRGILTKGGKPLTEVEKAERRAILERFSILEAYDLFAQKAPFPQKVDIWAKREAFIAELKGKGSGVYFPKENAARGIPEASPGRLKATRASMAKSLRTMRAIAQER